MNRPIDLFEYETLASESLSPMALDYYTSGAGEEVTLRSNRTAFEAIELRPRVLVDVSHRDLTTRVLDRDWVVPVAIAPMAFQCLADPLGELATARAAARCGTTMVLSTLSTQSIEDVAIAAEAIAQTPEASVSSSGSRLWFQLYVHRDRTLTQRLVERAEAAGYEALCVTVDAPILGTRKRDRKNQFCLPTGMALANLVTLSGVSIPRAVGESGLFAYFAEQLDASLTWRDLEWLRSISSLPVVVKGILRGDDAKRAVDCGVRGIVVSNHGGRQLDGAIASLDALPEVVDAVGDGVDVLIDGGIRQGTDVLKALALGAKAVLLGRPILWGLAVDGEAGVGRVLELVRAELDGAMALSGCPSVGAIDRSLVRWRR
ncbi:alpha-hydroxy-acid oxidizing protein [Oscillatoriales cyanobacterium LEGE 11467]|uniref:Alpha-hydroxy-acid oxidizing protein n=1 Tax=Zarconia navalis LEGE 11467 TaxID=1828826 RepID=A0A928W1D6_9CYAN|nr:alpha-hydroxy acid oxidase [Zarconia navalis]MBE9041495.1 alpha-hydroxy-acid oxidizing protein [Zarconia navalis LEGE 11467]